MTEFAPSFSVPLQCSDPDCDREAKKRGMCGRHYEQWRRTRPDAPRCARDGCDAPAIGRGLCNNHRHTGRRSRRQPRTDPAPGWRDLALCRDAGPDSPWLSAAKHERDAAALACLDCPVVEDCAAEATRPPRPVWGVWGGLDPVARGVLTRAEFAELLEVTGG